MLMMHCHDSRVTLRSFRVNSASIHMWRVFDFDPVLISIQLDIRAARRTADG